LFVVACFILLGRIWGWIGTAISLASSYYLMGKLDLTLYPSAMTSMCGATVATGFLSHMYLERFNYFFLRIDQHRKRLQHSSTYDHLTELLNAGAYYAECNIQLATCQYLNQPYTVLFVDLDHFKDINDTHGHATGDHVLQRVAAILRLCLRDSDLVGRVGGEEFSI
ncbi:MAG: GGDEF domain-containing protein, partial [Stenotrophomonas sp.]